VAEDINDPKLIDQFEERNQGMSRTVLSRESHDKARKRHAAKSSSGRLIKLSAEDTRRSELHALTNAVLVSMLKQLGLPVIKPPTKKKLVQAIMQHERQSQPNGGPSSASSPPEPTSNLEAKKTKPRAEPKPKPKQKPVSPPKSKKASNNDSTHPMSTRSRSNRH
jgi:cell division septation protein DedD